MKDLAKNNRRKCSFFLFVDRNRLLSTWWIFLKEQRCLFIYCVYVRMAVKLYWRFCYKYAWNIPRSFFYCHFIIFRKLFFFVPLFLMGRWVRKMRWEDVVRTPNSCLGIEHWIRLLILLLFGVFFNYLGAVRGYEK